MFWPFNKKQGPAPAPMPVDVQPLSIQPPSVEEFRQRLTETIYWCAARVSLDDPATCLRSVSLEPDNIGEPPVMMANPKWWLLPQEAREKIYLEAEIERQDIVTALARKRADLMRQERLIGDQLLQGLAGGRLLAYAPYENMCDGLAEAESRGFLDVDNAPAWDTWVCYIQDEDQPNPHSGVCRAFLISWVPPEFVGLVDDGITVNPEECINWLTKFNTRFTEDLQVAGLLGQ